MSDASPNSRLTGVQWLICFIASIGFAFDIYELLMLPLIARPALMELGGIQPGTPEFGMWIGRKPSVGGACPSAFMSYQASRSCTRGVKAKL